MSDEYIKKEDILNELGDVNMDILTDEVKEIVNGLPTYSIPDSAEKDKKIGDLTLRELKEMGFTVYTSPSLTNI